GESSDDGSSSRTIAACKRRRGARFPIKRRVIHSAVREADEGGCMEYFVCRSSGCAPGTFACIEAGSKSGIRVSCAFVAGAKDWQNNYYGVSTGEGSGAACGAGQFAAYSDTPQSGRHYRLHRSVAERNLFAADGGCDFASRHCQRKHACNTATAA